MITPPIGRVLDTSQQRCGFSPGDTDETTCTKAATWHIVWGIDLENGLTCDEHMAYARRYAYLDRHEITPDCSMPGSSWDFDGQRCIVEGLAEPEATTLALPNPVEVP